MRPVLSAERASSHCARIISPRSIYPRSPCLGLHKALSQRRDSVSPSSFRTRRKSPPLLPSHTPERHAFSSMADQSAQVSAQEALNAVESQCPKNTEPGKAEASGSAESKAEPALPPLSGHEFKQYNRLAEHMNYFVSWNFNLPLTVFFYPVSFLTLDLARTLPSDMEPAIHRSLIRPQAGRHELKAVHRPGAGVHLSSHSTPQHRRDIHIPHFSQENARVSE